MANLFADTSGWANIVDPSQIHHLLAVTLYRNARQQGQQLIVTNYILTELVALLTSPLRIPRPNIVALVEGLQSSPLHKLSILMKMFINKPGICCRNDLIRRGVW